jgi:hypothetical protein
MSLDTLLPIGCPTRSNDKLFIEEMENIALIQRIIYGANGKFA